MDTTIKERFHAYLTELIEVSKTIGHITHISTLAKKHNVAAMPKQLATGLGLEAFLLREEPITREESDMIRDLLCASWRKPKPSPPLPFDGSVPSGFPTLEHDPLFHWWERTINAQPPTSKVERAALRKALLDAYKMWDDEDMTAVPWFPRDGDTIWRITLLDYWTPDTVFGVEEELYNEDEHYRYEDGTDDELNFCGHHIAFPTHERADEICQRLNAAAKEILNAYLPPCENLPQ